MYILITVMMIITSYKELSSTEKLLNHQILSVDIAALMISVIKQQNT